MKGGYHFLTLKVLVVEDESIVAMDFQMLLEQRGFYVKTVSSGESAIKEIDKINYDLILMDVSLKDELDGIETAKIIRSGNPDVQLVFISGSSNLFDDERINLFKPFKFISKPLNVKELEEILKINI